MLYGYETKTAFTGFKQVQARITELTKALKSLSLDNCVQYFCSKFRIDREAYKYWLTGDMVDFAELVVLYLDEQARQAIVEDIAELRRVLA